MILLCKMLIVNCQTCFNLGGTVNTAVPPVKTLEGTVLACPPMIFATVSEEEKVRLLPYTRYPDQENLGDNFRISSTRPKLVEVVGLKIRKTRVYRTYSPEQTNSNNNRKVNIAIINHNSSPIGTMKCDI